MLYHKDNVFDNNILSFILIRFNKTGIIARRNIRFIFVEKAPKNINYFVNKNQVK